MCEYQRVDLIDNKAAPMCEFTKNFCTLCVFGNANTYKAAKLKDGTWFSRVYIPEEG